MKTIMWNRKAHYKARNLKAKSRVDSWTVSAETGYALYYTTHDGRNHKAPKNGWQILRERKLDA